MKFRMVSFLLISTLSIFIVVVLFNLGSNSEWIGFWGSMIGSFLGVVGVYATMRIDQFKREQERKQDFFISNISSYTELINILKIFQISIMSSELSTFKKSSEWYCLNKGTKISIEKFLLKSDDLDEKRGIRNILWLYISETLGKEFTVTFNDKYYIPEEEETREIKYDGLLMSAITELVELLAPRMQSNIHYNEDMEYILGSKQRFNADMSGNKYLNSFTNKSDMIYETLLSFPNSVIYMDFLKERSEFRKSIDEFRVVLEKRIESLHD